MDRLPAVIPTTAAALALLVAGCDDKGSQPAAPPSRVNAAKVAPQQGVTTEAFCDVYATAAAAKPLTWPALASGQAPSRAAAPNQPWRWINVWATWCKPCVEEIPRLVAWRERLGFDLTLLSMDASDDDVTAFRTAHPATPATLRVKDETTHTAWIAQLGLQGSPPIPIHVFVDPQDRVRCVRAGGVSDSDRAVIERLLRE